MVRALLCILAVPGSRVGPIKTRVCPDITEIMFKGRLTHAVGIIITLSVDVLDHCRLVGHFFQGEWPIEQVHPIFECQRLRLARLMCNKTYIIEPV